MLSFTLKITGHVRVNPTLALGLERKLEAERMLREPELADAFLLLATLVLITLWRVNDIHAYIHACMHACIHTYIHTQIH
jgi:hypothetical protein